MKFEIYQDQASQWCWCLKTQRGEKIAIGHRCYKAQDECVYVIALVQNSETAAIDIDGS